MHIQKVIKNYFIFVMAVSMVGLATYSPTVVSTFVSVFHLENSLKTANLTTNVILPEIQLSETKLIDFNVGNKGTNFAATPGASDVFLMNIYLKTYEQELDIEEMRFAIHHMTPQMIEGARIFMGGELVSEGKIDVNYVTFKGVNLELIKERETVLSIYVDLSEKLTPGDRVRLDIENPEDIKMTVGGVEYFIPEQYPVMGPYLSVVGKR